MSATVEFEIAPRRTAVPPLWATAVAGSWLALVLLAETLRHVGFAEPICNLRRLTGVPCPTCGSTRIVDALLRGDLAGAFMANPMVAAIAVALVGWLVVRVGFARRARLRLTMPARVTLGVVLAGLFALNWVFILARDL